MDEFGPQSQLSQAIVASPSTAQTATAEAPASPRPMAYSGFTASVQVLTDVANFCHLTISGHPSGRRNDGSSIQGRPLSSLDAGDTRRSSRLMVMRV